jgi:hypothetical protein
MCSQNADGTITTCGAHTDMVRLTEKLTETVEALSSRVVEFEKTIKLLRNAAILLVGAMMGTGVLQIKEILTMLGK